MGTLRADTTLVIYPSVLLANALAAFALNLVCKSWLIFHGRSAENCQRATHYIKAAWVSRSRQPQSIESRLVPCAAHCRDAPCAQAVFLLIGKTSALTMNIAGVIKDWALIFFSYSVFKAPVTALNLFGYFFCCTGASPRAPLVPIWLLQWVAKQLRCMLLDGILQFRPWRCTCQPVTDAGVVTHNPALAFWILTSSVKRSNEWPSGRLQQAVCAASNEHR